MVSDAERPRTTAQRLSVDPTRPQTIRNDAPGIEFEMLARGQEVQPERRATGRRPRLDCSIQGDLRVEIPGKSNRILSLERAELDLEQPTGWQHVAKRSGDAQRHVGGAGRVRSTTSVWRLVAAARTT